MTPPKKVSNTISHIKNCIQEQSLQNLPNEKDKSLSQPRDQQGSFRGDKECPHCVCKLPGIWLTLCVSVFLSETSKTVKRALNPSCCVTFIFNSYCFLNLEKMWSLICNDLFKLNIHRVYMQEALSCTPAMDVPKTRCTYNIPAPPHLTPYIINIYTNTLIFSWQSEPSTLTEKVFHSHMPLNSNFEVHNKRLSKKTVIIKDRFWKPRRPIILE